MQKFIFKSAIISTMVPTTKKNSIDKFMETANEEQRNNIYQIYTLGYDYELARRNCILRTVDLNNFSRKYSKKELNANPPPLGFIELKQIQQEIITYTKNVEKEFKKAIIESVNLGTSNLEIVQNAQKQIAKPIPKN